MGILRNRSGNKTTRIRKGEATDLTAYDPIKDHVGQLETRAHRAAQAGPVAKAQNVEPGTVVRARDAKPPRKDSEAGVALPRRDYE